MSITPSHSYRPIAPSTAPQPILPRPQALDNKRKWSSTLPEPAPELTLGKSHVYIYKSQIF